MNELETAIFAAGCFWGVQFYFDQVPGVIQTEVGYTGDHTDNPTYEDVSYKDTGHAEAVLVRFDPDLVSNDALVKHSFRLHDPTQLNRQGPDVGSQYRSAIFYLSDQQKETAEKLKTEAANTHDKSIVTEIVRPNVFHKAEDYHQKYAEKTGRGMCHIPYKPIV